MNTAATVFDNVVTEEDTTTHHSNEIANASDVETIQAESRLLAVETATHVRDEDANAAAATCKLSEDSNAAAAKEKAKRRDVMSRSQENKNEKTSEGDDEIRRLVEERRNTAKGENAN